MKPLHAMLWISCASVALSGCSTVLPYSSDFSCKNDDHGRCIEPLNAYALAVSETEDTVQGTMDTGVPVAGSSSQRTRSWRKESGSTDPSGSRDPRARPGDLQLVTGPRVAPYEGYQQALYRELTGLIDQPETPMLTPPKTVRTLILPYSDGAATGTLYMPRYVYSIVEAPKFVMGNYLTTRDESDLASFLSAGRLGPSETSVFEGRTGPSGGPVDLRLPEPSGPELPPDDRAGGLLPALTSLQGGRQAERGSD